MQQAEQRPATIERKDGKVITVDKAKAVVHEKVLDKGKAIHAVLEKAIQVAQPVKVYVDSKAEGLALRLINLMTDLVLLVRYLDSFVLPEVDGLTARNWHCTRNPYLRLHRRLFSQRHHR